LSAALLLAACCNIPLQAEILLIESFDADGPINDYTGWTGSATVSDGQLNVGNHEGGFYELASSITTGTIYFSVDMNITALGNYHGFSFFEDSTERAYYGMQGNEASPQWGAAWAIGGGSFTDPLPETNLLYKLVGKIDLDTTPFPKGWFWIDPSPDATDEDANLATAGATNINFISRIRLQAGIYGAGHYDNLIVGENWTNVMGNIQSPSSMIIEISQFTPTRKEPLLSIW